MTQQATRPDMTAALGDHGYRVTSPRREIFRMLESQHDGFTAEELVAALPSLGRATVYRTLKLLHELDIICRLNMPDGGPRYTLSQVEHHHHAVCVDCGRMWEFRMATLEQALGTLAAEVPGTIVGHRMDLYVACTDCLQASPTRHYRHID